MFVLNTGNLYNMVFQSLNALLEGVTYVPIHSVNEPLTWTGALTIQLTFLGWRILNVHLRKLNEDPIFQWIVLVLSWDSCNPLSSRNLLIILAGGQNMPSKLYEGFNLYSFHRPIYYYKMCFYSAVSFFEFPL